MNKPEAEKACPSKILTTHCSCMVGLLMYLMTFFQSSFKAPKREFLPLWNSMLGKFP